LTKRAANTVLVDYPDTPDMPKTVGFLRFFLSETTRRIAAGRPAVARMLDGTRENAAHAGVLGSATSLLVAGTAGFRRPPPRERDSNTQAFCAANQGVGFAIVGPRGYGRRRWPV
jgi:hypothetical protein